MPPWGNRSKPKPAQRPRGEIESAESKKINNAVANVAAKHTDPSRGGRYGHQGGRPGFLNPRNVVNPAMRGQGVSRTTFDPGQRGAKPSAVARNRNQGMTKDPGQRGAKPSAVAAARAARNQGMQLDPGQKAVGAPAGSAVRAAGTPSAAAARRAQTEALVRSAAGAQMDPGQKARAAAQGRAPSMWGPNQQMPTTPEDTEAMKMAQVREWLATDDAKRFLGGADTTPPTGDGGANNVTKKVVDDVVDNAVASGATDEEVAAIVEELITTGGGNGDGGVSGGGGGDGDGAYVHDPWRDVDPYASAINLGGEGTPYRRPADLGQQIRDLMAERKTQDFSQDIKDMISERRTGLTEAEARRMGQIADIQAQLGTDIGALETDRLAQQQAMIDAIAGRTSGFTGGIQDRLTAAREALGPQVTDEFEQVAQLVGGLGGSQAASSQDAMSRLAQVANMAAAERGAAPGQLAAEAKLALGDEAFRMFQGLDQEQTQRLMDESMRQEAFNTRRDEDMVNALLGDVGRREDFLTRETERQQQMDYGRGERIEGQQFQTGERIGAQDWRTGEREAAQLYGTGEREAAQLYGTGEREAAQTWREGESDLDRKLRTSEREAAERFQTGERELDRDLTRYQTGESSRQRGLDRNAQRTAATKAFQRSQQQIRESNLRQDDLLKAEKDAQEAASLAEAAGDLQAASYYGLGDTPEQGAAIWGQMGPTERKAVRDRWNDIRDMEGKSGLALDSYGRMVGRYGEDSGPLVTHAMQLMRQYPSNSEEDQQGRLNYVAQLTQGKGMEKGALNASEGQLILAYYAEMTAGAEMELQNFAQDTLAGVQAGLEASGMFSEGTVLEDIIKGGKDNPDYFRGEDWTKRIEELQKKAREGDVQTAGGGTGRKYTY